MGVEVTTAFELNDAQYEFVYDDAQKYLAYIGGIGAGKSFAGALKAYRFMLEHPGCVGTIGAPNYPQLRDSTQRSFFQIVPPEIIADHDKTNGIVRFVNGSEVMLRNMSDPDTRRGPNLAWFWLDEAPLCGYYAWQVMKGRLRQQGYPQQAWATGTPHGQDEFYEDFENDPKPNHVLYRASTRANAHNLPDGYISDLGYTGQFALQEIDGLFVNFEGLVYEFHREWHIGEWPGGIRQDGTPRRAPLRIGGVDWGFTNPAVALPIWVDGDDTVYVMDEYYRSRTGLEGVAAACVEFSRKYGIEVWYCGPDEPEHISELNARFGREKVAARAVAANDDITTGIETVRRVMAKDLTTGATHFKLSAACVETRAEYLTYSYASRSTVKRDPTEKPMKRNDHAMDAVRYALHTVIGTARRSQPMTQQQLDRLRIPRDDQSIGGVRILRREF